MTPYLAIISARFRLLFQYRAVAFAGVATQIFWGLLRVMIYTAFFNSVTDPGRLPLTLEQTITYIWLAQSFLLLLPWKIEKEVELMVRTGGVAYELIRPVDLYVLWFSRAFAFRLAPTLSRVLPVLILAWFFFGMNSPASGISAGLFLLSLCGSVLLGAALTALMMISLFWTTSGNGLGRIINGLMLLFSGIQVPLPFFPEWAKPLIYSLPFRGLIDTPFRLYMGDIAPAESAGPLLNQLIWIGVLVSLGRYLMQRAQKHLVVQGG